MHEMNTVLPCVEPDHVILLGDEPIVGGFDLTATGGNVNQFLLILVIVKVILGKPLIGFENRDIEIERVDT